VLQRRELDPHLYFCPTVFAVSDGGIAGLVVGLFVAVVIAIIVICIFLRRGSKRTHDASETEKLAASNSNRRLPPIEHPGAAVAASAPPSADKSTINAMAKDDDPMPSAAVAPITPRG
jgi:hypothetical protein